MIKTLIKLILNNVLANFKLSMLLSKQNKSCVYPPKIPKNYKYPDFEYL